MTLTKPNSLATAILCVLSLSSICSAQQTGGKPSVETLEKVAIGQLPAFEGQTRIQSVKTKASVKTAIITEALKLPWGLDFLPDGKMVVSEREGAIRLIEKNGQISAPLAGVPKVRYEAVSGMADIKVSPDFATSRFIFWTYMEPVDTDKGVNCVARGRLSSDEKSLEDVQVIYRTKNAYADAYHTGSRMLFDKEGKLLVTMGDRYQDSIRVQA